VTDKVNAEVRELKAMGRMKWLHHYEYQDKQGVVHRGIDYLEGKCGTNLLRAHTVDWYGIIPDINNENTIEMEELIETLTSPGYTIRRRS